MTQIHVTPLVWTKKEVPVSGGELGGWTMTAETPLKRITIDYHAEHEKKGVRAAYHSNVCGGFNHEEEAIRKTEEFYVNAVLSMITRGTES